MKMICTCFWISKKGFPVSVSNCIFSILKQKQDEESLLCGLDRLLNDDQRSVLKNLKCQVEMLFSGHDVLVAAEIENDCNELNNTIHTGHIASASHLSPLLDTLDIVNALGHIHKQFQCTQ